MSIMDLVRMHVRTFNAVQTEAELANELHRATQTLRCDHYALGHHVDLRHLPKDAILITDYDPRWVSESLGRQLYRSDPILTASTRTAVAFRWSDVEHMISLTDQQREILERARDFALHDGFTIPVHIPGEYLGTCSFGASHPIADDEELFSAAQLIGVFAFEAARRIKQRGQLKMRRRMPSLSSREIECVTLIACGKTDWEAAQILGIRPNTVHQHVESARRKYGGVKRTQLVAYMLFDGQVPFSSVIL